jgi:hypothetical protein
MTRRESLLQLGAAFMAGAQAHAQSSLSTRDDFLNWSKEEEGYDSR